MYKICLSIDAKKELLSQKEKGLLRINSTIENLFKGLWKGGTRVKKLRAVNKKKCIYEARIDKARRLLFSVLKTDDYESPLIFIYNLAVEHDKVIKTAQSILGEDYSEELYSLDEKYRKTETIESIVENEKVYYPEQSYVFNFLEDSKFYEFTEEDLLRILYKGNLTEDDLIEFKLMLTKEQKELIEKPLPMLIAGTAGSGKTTILIYKMMCNPSEPKLYITYNDKLCKEAENLFRHLVKGMDNEKDYIKNSRFTTFENILNSFYGDLTKTIMTKERFINEYLKYSRGNQLDKKFPPLMVWEEIRGVWKIGNESISLKQYLDIPPEEAPNFVGMRKEAYKIYQWYDKFLKDSYIEDDLDLLRKFINSDRNLQISYSLIVCDEVQDLTRLHMLFLFKIARNNPYKLLIAGDDHQIINHSGFRWENIKNLFYKELNKTRADLYKLNKNFRCVGNIANLASSINELQKEFIDEVYKTKTLKSKPGGEKPTLFYNVCDLDLINKIYDLGPTQAVIVKNKEEKNRLKEFFTEQYKKSPLIFTIEEAKGLEFELVVLWKLANDKFKSNEEWTKINRRKGLELDNNLKKFIRYEASLLYVAITRAIKECFIYEGDKLPALWTFEKIKGEINFQSNLTKLSRDERVVFTSLDWFNQGKNLLNKELYSQALECFHRVDDIELKLESEHYIKLSKAKIFINSGELEKAANIYLQLGMLNDAERCLDAGSFYDRLINFYGTNKYGCKDIQKYNTYSIKKYDGLKDWHKSALFCKLNKRYLDALIRFKRAEEYKRAAEIAENILNDYNEAVELYMQIDDMRSVNRCKEKMILSNQVKLFN